jgi:hypothetical protein
MSTMAQLCRAGAATPDPAKVIAKRVTAELDGDIEMKSLSAMTASLALPLQSRTALRR